jgi:salicylate hydroxylase
VAADSILIAGAGIGGLTTALALARHGFRVRLFDQVEKLEEAGAGIQLAPNATRILIGLGLADRLKPRIVEPAAVRLRSGSSGRELAVLALQAPPASAGVTERYGAPYWVIHRADLHKSLIEAVTTEPGISLTLSAPVTDFTIAGGGVRATVHPRSREWTGEGFDGAILIGADGLWSRLRAQLGDHAAPRFAGRSAFRAVIATDELPVQHREPIVSMWLGPGGHVVHYPVRGGAAVNIVAVCSDRWQSVAWSTSADRNAVLDRFPASAWATAVRELLAAPAHWQKWALYDRPPLKDWGRGPVTLLGDAAHPMLPFLAQGASMAIEDAAVLTRELVHTPDDGQGALRRYEAERRPRTARVQHAARRSDFSYHLRGPAAFVRDTVMRTLGGQQLLAQYDWLYRWQP